MADQITQAYPKWNIPLKQLVNINNGNTEILWSNSSSLIKFGRKIISSDGSDPTKWEINEDEIGPFTTEYNRRNPNNKLTENDVRRLLIGEATNSNGAFLNERAAVINNNTDEDIRRSLVSNNKIPKVTSGAVGTVSADGQQINPVTLPPSDQSNTDGTDPKDTTLDVNTFDVSITPEGIKENYGSYVYPTNLGTNEQDFIQFSIKRYKPRNFNLTRSIGIIEERQQLDTVGTIALPIQPSISDSNNVDWNGLRINPLEMELASGSLNIMSGQGQEYVDKLFKRLEGTIKDENTLKAIKLYFAQKAAGVNGLLSRFGGGIVNPNLELLFQGPTLRPFTFTFRLSPRDKTEATQVRSIIRVFKEAMSVKTASQEFFLAAPDVFDIRYCQRGDTTRDHPSLNKIKTCALKSCNVDYTPDGSYMTFNDESNTMVSYNLTLQFQELEPVTSKDYDNNLDQIGY